MAEGMNRSITMKECLDRKTIILGDINSGKTGLTRSILEESLRAGYGSITVIDMAPERQGNVGGKLALPTGRSIDRTLRILTTTIDAPRLMGRNDDEIEALAAGNAGRIEQLFQVFLADPASILFINDVSLYLQGGSPERLREVMDGASTVVINGYFGHGLGDSAFSRRERERMELLMAACDRVIRL